MDCFVFLHSDMNFVFFQDESKCSSHQKPTECNMNQDNYYGAGGLSKTMKNPIDLRVRERKSYELLLFYLLFHNCKFKHKSAQWLKCSGKWGCAADGEGDTVVKQEPANEPTTGTDDPIGKPGPELVSGTSASKGGGGGGGNEEDKGDEHISSSDDDNTCVICMDIITNLCFTDSCFHRFCFNCLSRWSRIQPHCPLCKQRFTRIYHNIRSDRDYEEFIVPSNPGSSRSREPDHNLFRTELVSNVAFTTGRLRSAVACLFQSVCWFPEGGSSSWSQPVDLSARRRRRFGGAGSGIEFRRDVYRYNLWIRPSSDRRVREANPEFYQNNPSQLHRLAPWLTRELSAVMTEATAGDSGSLFEAIMELLTNVPIGSREFYRSVMRFLQGRTAHFIHEFYNYATSPLDLIEWDAEARYSFGRPGSPPMPRVVPGEPGAIAERLPQLSTDMGPYYHHNHHHHHHHHFDGDPRLASRRPEHHCGGHHAPVANSSSSESSSSEVVGCGLPHCSISSTVYCLRMNQGQHSRVQGHVSTQTMPSAIELESGDERPIPFRYPPDVRPPQSPNFSLITILSSDSDTSEDDAHTDVLSSASDSSVKIISVQPARPTTPEIITIDSNSDSDVIEVTDPIVKEEKVPIPFSLEELEPLPSTSGTQRRTSSSPSPPPREYFWKRRHRNDVNYKDISSTSSDDEREHSRHKHKAKRKRRHSEKSSSSRKRKHKDKDRDRDRKPRRGHSSRGHLQSVVTVPSPSPQSPRPPSSTASAYDSDSTDSDHCSSHGRCSSYWNRRAHPHS